MASPSPTAAPPSAVEVDLAPSLSLEVVSLASLRPHPRNYRAHPDDQLAHLKESLIAHGVYRNVVIAREGTILAGHGVVKAAQQLGWTELPVRRLDLPPDDPLALKVLVGDNEMARLGLMDDRALTELLKELAQSGNADSLLGTGFNEAMLAALTYVTRPASEIADKQTAAQWVGMPEFEEDENGRGNKLIVHFANDDNRRAFGELIGQDIADKLTTWWPPREKEDLRALRLE